ncbi:MAG: hypothetical protein K8R58_10630 [Bacteroidales bacterium]|nr:hypothetical protein [Bacteroidales bacterium]
MSKYLTTGLKDFNFLFGHSEGIEMDNGILTSLLIQGEAGVGKTTLALQLAINMILNNNYEDGKRILDEEKMVRCFYLSFDQPKELIGLMISDFKWKVDSEYITDISKDDLGLNLQGPFADLLIVGRDEFHSIEFDKVDLTIKRLNKLKGDRHTIFVFDCINAINEFMSVERRSIINFIDEMRFYKSTFIFVKEEPIDNVSAPSEYIADYIIKLDKQSELYIEKTRLHKGFRGPHEYEIICNSIEPNDFKNNGFVVYPNLSSCNKIEDFKNKSNSNNEVNENKRASFGIDKLDKLLEVGKEKNGSNGMKYSSSLLIKGVAGSLKTELAMQFLYNGFLEAKESCLFISFRMDKDALEKVEIFNNKNRKEFFNQYFKFYDGRDPFKSASQFMSEIKNEIESSDKIRRVVVFGMGMLNTYTGLKGEVLEFLQVLIEYFKQKEISSIFIDWFRSTDIQETLPTEKAQEFIGNQIDIRIDKNRLDINGNPLREMLLERKEHRYNIHQHIGNLSLRNNKLNID